MNPTLTLNEIEAYRKDKYQNILLLITRHCPVECEHCSIEASNRTPKLSDYHVFKQIIEGIADNNNLRVIGISGGEPFCEQKALTFAVKTLRAAGKHNVIITSGYWGILKSVWIQSVVRLCSAVILSVDVYHNKKIGFDTLLSAGKTILGNGTNLIIQYINSPQNIHLKDELLSNFKDYKNRIYSKAIPFLSEGRGKYLLKPQREKAVNFQKCSSITSPVITYDGRLFACCSEHLINAKNCSARFEKKIKTKQEFSRKLDEIYNDPFLKKISDSGIDAMLTLPGYKSLASNEYEHICDICRDMDAITTDPKNIS